MKTNDIGIVKLPENIHAGKIQLPDFSTQLGFDNKNVNKNLDKVAKN